MKTLIRKTPTLIFLFVCVSNIHAAEIAWTNSAGGNWTVAANWSPNAVPGASDIALITNGGNYTVTASTVVTVSGLTLGGASGTPTLTIASQTLTLNGPSTVSGNGVLVLNAGALTGTGELSVSGQFNWNGGTHSGSGVTTLASSGVLTIAGTGSKTLSGRTLLNAGTVAWNSSPLNLGGGALFTNAPSGIFDIAFAGTVGTVAGGGIIANAGLVRKMGGTSTASIGVAFNNSGAVETQSGTFVLNGAGTNSGSFSISSAATLDLSSSGVIEMNPESSISGAGNLTVSGMADLRGLVNVAGTNTFDFGTAEFTGTYTISGPLVFSGGNANFNGSGTIVPTSLDLIAGILGGTNAVIVSGLIHWTAGDFSGANAVVANGGLIMDSAGTKDLVGRTLINIGAASWNAGPLRLGGGALFTNAPSGTFDITVADQQSMTAIAGGGGVANAGLLRKRVGTNAAVISSGPFTNTGTVEIQTGTLRANSGYTQEDGLTFLTGGDFSSTQPIRINGGTLAGNGIVSANVTNRGSVSPGASPGALTIAGNYYQIDSGALDIELAGPPTGTNYDRLLVTGTAALAGALNVRLSNDFYPAPNVIFTNVIRAASRTGTFASFNYPSNSLGLQLNYGTTNVNLEVVNTLPSLPAPPNQTLDELTLLSFNVGATDGDAPAQVLSYSLVNAPANASIDSNGGLAWAPDEAQGPVTTNLSVRVTDNGTPNLTVTRTFQVLVNEVNVAPQLALPSDQSIDEQTAFEASAMGTDPDLPINALAFELVAGPVGLTVSPSGVIQWTPTEAQGSNTYAINVRVTDTNLNAVNAQQLSTTNSFSLTVNEVNLPPALSLPANQVLTEETSLDAAASASDPDFPPNALTFSLVSPPPGMTIDSISGVISWTPDEAQGSNTYAINVRVTDQNAAAVNAPQLSVTNSFTIVVTESNRPPALLLPPDQTISELTTFSTNAMATDPDWPANALTFALVSGPAGLTVSASGEINWMPTEDQGPGTNTVVILVSDRNTLAANATSLSATNTFTIRVNEVNAAPVVGNLADRTVNPGQVINFIAAASDSDDPVNTLTFDLLSPPSGASIVAGSGVFNWRPTMAQAGSSHLVRVRVTDDGAPNLSGTNSFTVVVNPLSPVVLMPVQYTNGQFSLRVSGPIGPDYILQASTTLTNWISLGTNTPDTMPFEFIDIEAGSSGGRFYRARLQP